MTLKNSVISENTIEDTKARFIDCVEGSFIALNMDFSLNDHISFSTPFQFRTSAAGTFTNLHSYQNIYRKDPVVWNSDQGSELTIVSSTFEDEELNSQTLLFKSSGSIISIQDSLLINVYKQDGPWYQTSDELEATFRYGLAIYKGSTFNLVNTTLRNCTMAGIL